MKRRAHSAMSTIFLMTRSQRSRIWSGDSPSGQPMVQMSQSSPISDRIVEVVLPARIPPHSDSAPRCVRSTREEPHPSPRRRKERTFTDSIFPFPHILLNGATRFLVDVLEQQVVRLLGALPRRDKHVLDVGRVEDLSLADDASPELADDGFAVRGQGDVGQSGLRWGQSVSTRQGIARWTPEEGTCMLAREGPLGLAVSDDKHAREARLFRSGGGFLGRGHTVPVSTSRKSESERAREPRQAKASGDGMQTSCFFRASCSRPRGGSSQFG